MTNKTNVNTAEILTERDAPHPERQATLDFGPGAKLADARRRKQMTVGDIAEHLHVATTTIDALERDDYAALPPPLFVRGYLRNYADVVGLDPEHILNAYAKLGMHEVEHKEQEERFARIKTVAKSRRKNSKLPALIVIAFIALAVWWVMQHWPLSDERQSSAVDAPAVRLPSAPSADTDTLTLERSIRSEPVLPQPEAVAPVEPMASESAQVPDPDPAGAEVEKNALVPNVPAEQETQNEAVSAERIEPLNQAAPVAEVVSPAVTTAKTPIAPDAVLSLELIVTGESWVSVKDGTGQRLYVNLVKGPAIRRMEGQLPFALTFGDAAAVDVKVDGEFYNFGQKEPGRVAKFSISADDLNQNR